MHYTTAIEAAKLLEQNWLSMKLYSRLTCYNTYQSTFGEKEPKNQTILSFKVKHIAPLKGSCAKNTAIASFQVNRCSTGFRDQLGINMLMEI